MAPQYLDGITSERELPIVRRIAIGSLRNKLLSFVSIVGVLAMLWVGGHIMVAQLAEMGWHAPERALVTWGHHIGGIGGWTVKTVCAGIVGLAGGLVLTIPGVVRHRSHD